MWKVVKTHPLSLPKAKTFESLRPNCFYLANVHCLVFNKKPRISDYTNFTFTWLNDAEDEARDICRYRNDPNACEAFAAGHKFLVIESEIDENAILSKVILETGKVGWVGFALEWSDEPQYEIHEIVFI